MKVIAIGRDDAKAREMNWASNVEFIQADIYADRSEACDAIRDAKPDILLHLAWSSLPHYRSLANYEIDLVGSMRFLRAAVEHGVNRILGFGTCLEYGMQSGRIAPDAPIAPILPYPGAKAALHRYLIDLQSEYPDLSVQWLRLFYLWGEGQSEKTLYGQLKAAIDRRDERFDMSGGIQLRDYLHVKDVARQALWLAAQTDRPGAFNCCSGAPISVRQFVEDRIKAAGAKIQLNLGHYPYPTYEPMAFWGEPISGAPLQEM